MYGSNTPNTGSEMTEASTGVGYAVPVAQPKVRSSTLLLMNSIVVTSCGTIQEVAMVPHMVPIAIGKVLVQSNALSRLQVK
jgi:hypothetical protein